MDRTAVITALVAFLSLAVTVWAKPLERLPFWLVVILCAAFYPVGRELFPAVESAGGEDSAWAEWIFMVSASLLFAALAASAFRKFRSVGDTARTGRQPCHDHGHDIDA
ncbi:hypothetical protein CUT44_02935 [Streptomyces carminius]|uniref:Uncharacterized protein n=1 Tax=Streptomyces carminius TaxID=2665496 RepID=A0A2M8M5L3_9ACTN|nr:hypothetical protein [Streptomyces carminius]PJE99497.1 hypothetical protein CUT44_02935 [Streptomyces carminius]